jgi:hypothetical protein
MAVAGVERLAAGARPRQAGHCTRLAPTRIPSVVDVEEVASTSTHLRGSLVTANDLAFEVGKAHSIRQSLELVNPLEDLSGECLIEPSVAIRTHRPGMRRPVSPRWPRRWRQSFEAATRSAMVRAQGRIVVPTAYCLQAIAVDDLAHSRE